MTQALGQVVAELSHVDRHFIKRWRGVGTDLHIDVAETTSPVREQMARQPLMTQTEPFRSDDHLLRLGVKQLVVEGDEGNCEAFGEFRIGETAFRRVELARRA